MRVAKAEAKAAAAAKPKGLKPEDFTFTKVLGKGSFGKVSFLACTHVHNLWNDRLPFSDVC